MSISQRWKRSIFTTNQGKQEHSWSKGPWTILQNYPVYEDGKIVRWDYEVFSRKNRHHEKLIGRAKSLASAKKLAEKHDH